MGIIEGWKNNILRNDSNVEDIAKKRMSICNDCEHHSKNHNTIRPDEHCTYCGCTLAAKTRSMGSKCPINKWKQEN